MNIFLKQVNIDGGGVNSPSFVRSDVDTQAIQRAGTTGNQAMDIMFKTAIKIAQNSEDSKRKNELAEVQTTLNRSLKEYEASWADRDKNHEMYHQEYLNGLDSIYEDSKALLSTTKYTTKDDITGMESSIQRNQDDTHFKILGEKAIYDTKENTSRTLMNYDSMILDATYETDPAKSSQKLRSAFELLDTLKGSIGMTDQDILKMKSDGYNKHLMMGAEHGLNQVIASPVTNDEKLLYLQKLNPGVSIEKLQEVELTPDMEFEIKDAKIKMALGQYDNSEHYTNDLIKSGISKTDAQLIADNSKRTMVEARDKQDGIYERIRNKMLDERTTQNKANEKAKADLQKSYTSDVIKYEETNYKQYGISNNKEFFKNIIGVNLESNTIFDLHEQAGMNNLLPDLENKILNENGYFSIYDEDDAKDMIKLYESQIFGDEPLSPYDVYGELFDDIKNTGSIQEQTNMERSLVARGVLTRAQIKFMDDSNIDAFNYISVGKAVNKGPEANRLSGIIEASKIGQLTKGFNGTKKKAVADLIIGYAIDNNMATVSEGKINTQEIMVSMQNDTTINNIYNDLKNDIEKIGMMEFEAYREVKMDLGDVRRRIENKHEFVDKTHRQQGPTGFVTDRVYRDSSDDDLDNLYFPR